MRCHTDSYVRVDGTRKRYFLCVHVHRGTGLCDLVVDATSVDRAVMENLGRLLPRFDQWVARLEDRHAEECERLTVARDRAARDVDQAEEVARSA